MNSAMTAQYNTSRVLRSLWLNPGISRVEIAESLGLNRSTITHIVNELTDRGLVKTLACGDSSPLGGRKKVQLGINKDFGCIVGLDLRPDSIRLVVVNMDGEVILEDESSVKVSGKNLYTCLRGFYDRVKSEEARLGLPLLGIGFGIAGIVNPVEEVIQQSIPLAITEKENFGEKLRDFISEPVLLDNDANCCCWGEIIGRRSGEKSNFLFISGDWRKIYESPSYDISSIGMGIVINDMVHYGKHFSAGEFRSIEWKPGNISQFSMSDEQISATKTDHSLFLVMVRELARNTALLVNVLNLEHLYLGGFFESENVEVKRIFEEEISRNWTYPNRPECQVLFSTYGKNAVAYGAAGMFLERIFGNSRHLSHSGLNVGIDMLISQTP